MSIHETEHTLNVYSILFLTLVLHWDNLCSAPERNSPEDLEEKPTPGLISGSFMSFENGAASFKVQPISLDKHISTADKWLSPDGSRFAFI